jgi:hypothetical protein
MKRHFDVFFMMMAIIAISCVMTTSAGPLNASEALAASGPESADFSYSDMFDTLDRDFWLVFNHGGGTGPYTADYSLANISDGILELPVKTTDKGPELISRPLKITANSIITATWRIYLHYANDNFAGRVAAALVDYDTMYDPKGESVRPYMYYDENTDSASAFYLMQVHYSNYSYNNYQPPVGGNSFGICGSVSGPVNERCVASEAVWDTFVTDKVEINIPEGVAKYWENGKLIGEVKLNPDVDYNKLSYIRFWISPYGWYTGHEVDMNWFFLDIKEVAQCEPCDENALAEAEQKGFDAGRQSCINDPASCGLSPGSNSEQGRCATFDFLTNSLRIPCFDAGSATYWLDLNLTNTAPVTLILNSFGENGPEAPQQPTPSPSAEKSITLSSINDYSFSFVTEKITSSPDFDKNYDLMLEAWCVDQPALCGNFLDIGAVDLNSVADIPSSGYLSDKAGYEECVEVDSAHTFISKNRDGSHTAFRITRHEKPSTCDHVVDITYRDLD